MCENIKPLQEKHFECPASNTVQVAATLIDSKGNKYGPINIFIDRTYLRNLPKLK